MDTQWSFMDTQWILFRLMKDFSLKTPVFVRVGVCFDDIRMGGKKICTLGHLRWKQIFFWILERF
jgi:hypothetical protein